MEAAREIKRIQTALVTAWPTPIDMKLDILIPGKAEKWARELNSALRSRNLLDALLQAEPDLQDMVVDNPDDETSTLMAVYYDIMDERMKVFQVVADCLPAVVNYASLGMSDQAEVNSVGGRRSRP
jgi:hypothetical protein